MEGAMRILVCVVCATVVLVLLCGIGVRGDAPEKQEKPSKIDDLIKQLGDDSFAKREAASKALAQLGEPALAALRKAADSSDDAEVRTRATRLVEVIQRKLGYLFNGKDLSGWYVEAGAVQQWTVE